MADTVIVKSTPETLIAEQPPQSEPAIFVFLPMLLFIGFVISPIRKRDWSGVRLLAGIFGLMVLLMVGINIFPKSIYRCTIHFDSGIIDEQELDAKTRAVKSETKVMAADLASADMKYNRGDGAIILVHHDGSLDYPLGNVTQQNAPGQYVVLTALRRLVQEQQPK